MPLTTLVISHELHKTRPLIQALELNGHRVVSTLQSSYKLTRHVQQWSPDLIIISMGCLDKETLENISVMSAQIPRPILFIAHNSQSASAISAAVNAGVSAYLFSDINSIQIEPAIAAAMAQFQALTTLREQRDSAIKQLEDKQLIDKAKALLIRHQHMSEPQAYKTLQKLAMNRGEKLPQVARNVIQSL